MDATHNAALAALGERRFAGFAEAADAALAGLADAVPGTVVLARFDPDGETCRVTDLRGAPIQGLEQGVTLRVSTPGIRLDKELLNAAGIRSSLVAPLELHDGSVVGLVCAFDPTPGAYMEDHRVLVTVAGRILAYEWEVVRAQAELRHLREEARDRGNSDPETGLFDRDAFIDVLDREWRLSKRGTVQSYLVAARVVVGGTPNGTGSPIATLALKDAAEVLAGVARTTDHVGRVGAATLAAVLVGCHGPEGAEAFVERYRHAVARATQGRPFSVEIATAYRDIKQFESASEALAGSEDAASAAMPPAAGVEQGAGA
jgi:GGDEF domain-containing protein